MSSLVPTGDHTVANSHSPGCIWNDTERFTWALNLAISQNFHQLLLQAYSTFSVYNQREVFIMLVPGAYFTMLKFKQPKDFKPLPQGPDTSNKKRKLRPEESGAGEPKYRAAVKINEAQLIALIPPECVEVIYHGAPVFDDIQARELRLSDAFRQALRERLDDVDFQPCSLFDLHSAQYVPGDRDLVRPAEPHIVRHSRVPSECSQGSYF